MRESIVPHSHAFTAKSSDVRRNPAAKQG